MSDFVELYDWCNNWEENILELEESGAKFAFVYFILELPLCLIGEARSSLLFGIFTKAAVAAAPDVDAEEVLNYFLIRFSLYFCNKTLSAFKR